MLIALLLAAAAPPGGLTEEELAEALKGEVPVRSESFTTKSGKSAGRGLGAVVVDRNIAACWDTVSRYEDKHEYIPRLESTRVIEKTPEKVRVRMEVNATLTTVTYTGIYHLDQKTRRIHWELDPTVTDNGIAETEGEWLLFELAPEKTLIVYRVYVDSGRAVPKFVQEYMAVKSIPDLLGGVKKRVESGATWKK